MKMTEVWIPRAVQKVSRPRIQSKIRCCRVERRTFETKTRTIVMVIGRYWPVDCSDNMQVGIRLVHGQNSIGASIESGDILIRDSAAL
jgi:hypothetical protein